MDRIDGIYLFGNKFEEKLSKLMTAKQKSKSLFPLYWVVMVCIVSPFGRALCHNTNKVVRGKDSCLQEQLTEEVNFYLKNQNFQQHSSEVLSPILFHKIHPIIKDLLTQWDLGDLTVAGRLKHFHMNWGKLTSDPFVLNLV